MAQEIAVAPVSGPPRVGVAHQAEHKKTWEQVALLLFIAVPFAAVLVAVPLAWGWGLSWHDVAIAVGMYAITGHGVTVGFHRHFTHHAFKTKRWLRSVMAVCGMMAIEGPVITWVADHRRHHRFTDRPGDPHSPWRYGRTFKALTKGFVYAHVAWLFYPDLASEQEFAPDLWDDPTIRRLSAAFPAWVVLSMLLPPLLGGLWAWSWQGALTAFFWGSLVRVAALHHVTFSINSVCHIVGRAPFRTKDHSRNVWWLAVPSMGESWHNFHHAQPNSARHGVGRFEVDTSAVVIRAMEAMRWAWDVRWPDEASVARRRVLGVG